MIKILIVDDEGIERRGVKFLLKHIDEEFDIAVRKGYHCSPFIHDFINSKQYNGTVRISLNYFNTKEEIDKLIEALKSL